MALIFRCRGLAMDPVAERPAAGAADHTIEFGAAAAAPAPNPNSDGGQQAAPAGHAADRPRSGRRGPRARESMDKEEEREPMALIFRCRGLAMDPVAERPAAGAADHTIENARAPAFAPKTKLPKRRRAGGGIAPSRSPGEHRRGRFIPSPCRRWRPGRPLPGRHDLARAPAPAASPRSRRRHRPARHRPRGSSRSRRGRRDN